MFNRMLPMLFAAGFLSAAVFVNPASGQDLTVERIVQIYLMQDCGTGEPDPAKWLKDVLKLGDTASPLLLAALESGPSNEARDELQRSASGQYKKMRDFLERGGLEALENEDIRRDALELKEEQYVQMRMTGFVRGYRERALHALIELGDANVIDALEKIRNQPDLNDALRIEIERGIEKLRGKDIPE